MASKITKRGKLDNVITYEHICDTTADLADIPLDQINLGSVALVLQGSAGLEIYMANSNKQWINLIMSSGDQDNGGA